MCSFLRLPCLLTAPSSALVGTLSSIFYVWYGSCLVASFIYLFIVFMNARRWLQLLLFVLVVFRDTDFLWHSSNAVYLPCVFHLLHLQCPFIDEYILALHNKIRTKLVDFPETWVHLLRSSLSSILLKETATSSPQLLSLSSPLAISSSASQSQNHFLLFFFFLSVTKICISGAAARASAQ